MTQRLVFVVTEDWAFWRHRRPMARAAREAGFEVHLITKPGERVAAIEREGVRVHPVDMKRGSLSPMDILAPVQKIRAVLQAIKPDIIHNVALKPVVIGTAAAVGMGVPVVNSINGLGSSFMAGSAREKAVKMALSGALRALHLHGKTRIIVQNSDDQGVIRGLGIAADKIVLIPGSGVDCDVLVPMEAPAPGVVRVAFVGRMLKDKGLRSLIRAMQMLRARGSRVELLLAGEPDLENPSSIGLEEFEGWSQEPGVTCLGHVEDIADVWRRAHVGVLTSRGGEGLPKCLLEAAACGRPMIASDIAGSRDICVDGETGLIVPIGDDEALAGAIERLAADAGMRARMGAAARTLVEARFSSQIIGAETVAVYRGLLAAGKS